METRWPAVCLPASTVRHRRLESARVKRQGIDSEEKNKFPPGVNKKIGFVSDRADWVRFTFSPSAVSLLAIPDAGNLNRIAKVAEEHAVILSTKPVERRLGVLQSLHVAFLGVKKPCDLLRICKAMGCGMERRSALAWSVKTTPLAMLVAVFFNQPSLAHGFPVCQSKPEISQNIFQRNGRVVLAPLVGFGHCLPVFPGEGFIVKGGERELAGNGIDHGLQKAFERGQLHGRQLIDKGMHVMADIGVHVLFLVKRCSERIFFTEILVAL